MEFRVHEINDLIIFNLSLKLNNFELVLIKIALDFEKISIDLP